MREHSSQLTKRTFIRATVLFLGLFTVFSMISIATWAESNRPALSSSRSDARSNASPAISSEEISKHIKYLASDELQGRRSGTPSCEQAASYITTRFKEYGLKPGGKEFLQPFEFIAGIKQGAGNSIKVKSGERDLAFRLGDDYQPYNFSASGQVTGDLVLAGFGITASSINYDDYANLDVKDKVVLVLPYAPDGNNLQGKFGEFLAVRRKTLTAREHGAKAVLFVSEADNFKDSPAVRDDTSYTDAGIIAIKISKHMADELLKANQKSVDSLLKAGGESGKGESLTLAKTNISLKADLVREMNSTANVVGWLEGTDEKLKQECIVIGAHYDHLGLGGNESLAADRKGIHHGADDNASGVAGLLELARVFGAERQNLRRSVVFIAFSGEELGLLGSNHYVKNPMIPLDKTVAMLNMDMIGRMRADTLIVGGIGTSPQWKPLVEQLNQTRGFVLKMQDDGYGPSDHASFYGKDIPVLFFFTGVHDDYHKPSDTADRINVTSEQQVVALVHDIAAKINSQDNRLEFSRAKVEGERRSMNSSFRVSLGSVPDYAEQVAGVKLSGVRPGSPAEKAGVKGGDIIVKLAGRDIRNIQDYTFVLQELKPNETIEIVVQRGQEKVSLQITPAPRQ